MNIYPTKVQTSNFPHKLPMVFSYNLDFTSLAREIDSEL